MFLFIFFLDFFFKCVCTNMYVCRMCADACRGQKRAAGPLELDLQAVSGPTQIDRS